MQVYRISKCQYIDDLSGKGASLFPGRWHSKGTSILYTAASPSLAMLESVVHITTIAKIELCMICLEIPDAAVTDFSPTQLPANWFTSPPPDGLKSIGDRFIRANDNLGLKLPSAVMPEECNILLNPAHALFNKIKIVYSRQLRIDERLFRS